jgi:hypothetical protein
MSGEDDKSRARPDPREAKLAEALRKNLRRRKVSTRPAPPADKPSTS